MDIYGFANAFLHRASTDVMTTFKQLHTYPIEQIIDRAKVDPKFAVARFAKEYTHINRSNKIIRLE